MAKRESVIVRAKRDCSSMGETFKVSKSIRDVNNYGECYVLDADNKVVQNGSLEDVLKERKLLRAGEVIV